MPHFDESHKAVRSQPTLSIAAPDRDPNGDFRRHRVLTPLIKLRIPAIVNGCVPVRVIVTLVLILLQQANASENDQSAVRSETLLRTSSSWDGEPYKSYPSGQPELSILKISIPPHTKLDWHSHPMPNATYIVAGELTVEREKDGKTQHFTSGQAVSETVDTFHRGVTGNEPVILIVFYAGSPGVPLAQYPRP
jgi:quercetin dioxygenase-like cupin family protein